ncbi:cytochrome C biogenesis protein [Lacihabitans sp. LS3-19]|uniref:cytochrome c biogenesis protein n=1 Tax=Lacihabitans sp. LS3-19 TaxID=2487335 RepID=UPI0020CF317B|nr:cytochrome c biogenesis protein CcsA [Lacihabitans sp. LS3-19]MCP9767881.1 cytochrome C biogenesis protein [Lacihabitans sp. LS3-19]
MIPQKILKIINQVTSTRSAGMYMLLFAIAIGGATFVENDFGTSSAQDVIFKSWWFELLLVLFSITILMNIWRFKLIKQKKWASVSFHLAIVIIVIGAGITRYIGTEGMMHIREGETTNKYLSSENFLKFQVLKGGKTYSFDESVYFSSLGSNKFSNSYQIGNSLIDVNLDNFIPNPTELATSDPNGLPMMKVVIGGAGGREEYYVKQGDKVSINGVNFNFTNEQVPNAFNVMVDGDSLLFITQQTVNQRVMATQKSDSLLGGLPHRLMLRSLYTLGSSNFVIGDYIQKGIVTSASGDPKIKNESLVGLNLSVSVNGKTQKTMVTGRKSDEGQAKVLVFDDTQVAISYGSRVESLPFSLTCRDFILEKYPGTENPSSYASEVTLIDPLNAVNREQRIFMNNILEYQGYRFFQSSFDQDELGTYLSVNHDYWGSLISYIGYAILTIGLILTFIDKKSRFSFLMKRLQTFQTQSAILIFTLGFSFSAFAIETSPITKEHAKAFGKLVVQDHNGRVKPVNTFTSELLRKIARNETLFDLNSDQLVLAMMLNPEQWSKASLIQIPNQPDIKRKLNTQESMVSYASFFGPDGSYILQEDVRAAQAMMPKDQGTYEKAIIKLDEKVNIVNMIFSGSLLRIFPQKNDPSNTWVSPAEVMHGHDPMIDNSDAKNLFLQYLQSLSDGANTKNFQNADVALSQIAMFQNINGSAIMPSGTKIGAELMMNKLDVFNRLKNYYGILTLLLTGLFLYITIKKKVSIEKWTKYAFYAMAAGFVFHTIGLGLRWYISGRAPWSNGYESMIYIGWTTMLAGTLISRKSLGGLAATATLAATILLVASMSWLDPEITPLVPVLKSYWLTIHVSLEAGSYGFLMLGAVIGMLNLVLMILINEKNKENVIRAIKELTIISEITLLAGLTMISIGTYLGGVWANESWGRYWGWDAKETWALVTILVYAFILHMRFIPKLQSIYAFNFASLFGFATVIMTYFGVNYYLSGLHSYAAGDPVPIPSGVYYTATILALLSTGAYLKYKKNMA